MEWCGVITEGVSAKCVSSFVLSRLFVGSFYILLWPQESLTCFFQVQVVVVVFFFSSYPNFDLFGMMPSPSCVSEDLRKDVPPKKLT